MIPVIVEESEVFVEKLNQAVESGEIIKINQLTAVLNLLGCG